MNTERGEVSITSVLVACTLLIVILSATLGLFEGFIARAGDATARTDSEDVARRAADRIARNLRNLADPTTVSPQVVERIGPTDLIFKMVDANGPNAGLNVTNTKRVRYCLDDKRQLLQQTQTWILAATPALPTTTACTAGAGWPSTVIAATDVVNATTQPIFSYDTTVISAVAGIHVDLLVDTQVGRGPAATRLSTGVFLRNQNRPPTAAFDYAKTAGGVVLNGSASTDPEGDVLKYTWYAQTGTDFVEIGTGITFTYTGLTAGSNRVIRLKVADPSDLNTQTEKSVQA